MKIILTNDDGIEARGLDALAGAASDLGEVIIVAPDRQHSGCGHRVTTEAAISLQQLGPSRFAISGTPADCTRVALHDLVPDADLLLAGINAGGNMGMDVYISGTVAAARESAILGVPAIAVSQYRRRDRVIDWARSSAWTRQLLAELVARCLGGQGRRNGRGALWNVNLPHPDGRAAQPDVVFCELDRSPLPVAFRKLETTPADGGASPPRLAYRYDGNYHERPREEGTDVDHCMSGRIAVTSLRI